MGKKYLGNFWSYFKSSVVLLVLSINFNAYAQIFPGQPGDPDAIVSITASNDNDPNIYEVNGVEACIQASNGEGANPTWQFDIIIPAPGDILPVSENIEIRVCRRGDFGQSGEGVLIFDEQGNQVGVINGENDIALDCSSGPACAIVTISSCSFNAQAADGIRQTGLGHCRLGPTTPW